MTLPDAELCRFAVPAAERWESPWVEPAGGLPAAVRTAGISMP